MLAWLHPDVWNPSMVTRLAMCLVSQLKCLLLLALQDQLAAARSEKADAEKAAEDLRQQVEALQEGQASTIGICNAVWAC